MRVRTLVFATAVIGAAATALALGAGSAGAVTPVTFPQAGAAGLELDHGETQAFANSPAPALIDHYLPGNNVTVSIRPDSQLPKTGDRVYASLRDIVAEAGTRPGGKVDLVLAPGPELVVVQNW